MTETSERGFVAALLARGKTHWWAAGMRRITWAMLGRIEGRVLDVGCGPGWELAELPASARGTGVDLRAYRGGAQPMVRADAVRLPFGDAAFDLVLALDLLEQAEVHPAQAIGEIARVLRPGGRLLVRVPAHAWLYGPHDAFWGGARRFGRQELATLIRDGGFCVTRLTYANSLLFLPAAMARLLARSGVGTGDDLRPLPQMLNRLLLAVLEVEAAWVCRHDLPVGLSLICLADRRPDHARIGGR